MGLSLSINTWVIEVKITIMSTKKILIASESKPYRNSGGPGRFAPYLFESLKQVNSEFSFFGYFDNCFYDNKITQWYYLGMTQESSRRTRIGNILAHLKIKLPILFSIYFLAKRTIIDHRNRNRLEEILSKYNINIINAHDYYISFLLKKIRNKKKCSLKLILHNHFKGSFYNEYIYPNCPHYRSNIIEKYFRNIEIEAINIADLIIFPSIGAKELLINDYPMYKDKIEAKNKIIYTGIEQILHEKKRYNIKNNKTILFLNIANHIPSKNIISSLKMFCTIKKYVNEKYKSKFINCGAFGSETGRIYQYIKNNELEKSVKILGVVDRKKIIELYDRADFLILTPTITVFDLVILEAMSIGLPIITSRTKGNIECLGENYPLLLPNESDEEMAKITKHLITLVEKDTEYEHISQYLYNRFQLFSKEKMLKEYISTFERFLGD